MVSHQLQAVNKFCPEHKVQAARKNELQLAATSLQQDKI
jgi:hypothetical protein